MHDTDIWLGIAIFILGGLFSMLAWFAIKKIEHYDRQHDDHYKHSAKSDIHWTSRERDELTKKLNDMGGDIKELLRRNGGPYSAE